MAKVFAAHKDDIMERYHEVRWTKGDNLNRGKVKRFKDWREAKAFAQKKAKELGCKAIM